MADKEENKNHEGTDGVESDHDPAPKNADPEEYKNIPGNQS